jgi:hypothetical protein
MKSSRKRKEEWPNKNFKRWKMKKIKKLKYKELEI